MTEEIAKESNGQSNQENNGSTEDLTDLEKGIIRQVEYYFGDLNLPRDKFLRDQVKLDDGWIPLELLTKFNRLAKLSTDLEVLANALNKSNSGLLEVSDDKTKVRRSPDMPLPEMNEERRKELMGRTVYVKGFTKEITLDDLLKYFKQYDETDNIIMRKYLDRSSKEKKFKGSVFVTFKTKELAEKFFSKKDEVKFEDKPCIVRWQEEYLQSKQEEYAARKDKKDKKETPKEEKEEFKLPAGSVLRFTEVPDKITRETIKEALTALGAEVAFIDFKQGDKDGWVRFHKGDTAKPIFEKIPDGKLKVGEEEIAFRLPEAEEEQQHLEKSVEEMAKRRKNQKQFNKHNKGGRNNFKGRFGKKRKQDGHDDAPPSKVKADS